MYRTLKNGFLAVHRSFRSSATILVARVNVMIGCVWTVVLQTDPATLANIAPILKDPKYLSMWIMINGFLTEYARRRPASRDALPPSAAGYGPSDSTVK